MAPRPPRRAWLLIATFALAAVLNAATWAGLAMGAFVLWDFVHAFYFQQSYAAGPLPLVVAATLALSALLLALRRPRLAAALAFAAMLVSVVLVARLGMVSPLHGFIHPIQLVPLAALALTVLGGVGLLARIRGRRAGQP